MICLGFKPSRTILSALSIETVQLSHISPIRVIYFELLQHVSSRKARNDVFIPKQEPPNMERDGAYVSKTKHL